MVSWIVVDGDKSLGVMDDIENGRERREMTSKLGRLNARLEEEQRDIEQELRGRAKEWIQTDSKRRLWFGGPYCRKRQIG